LLGLEISYRKMSGKIIENGSAEACKIIMKLSNLRLSLSSEQPIQRNQSCRALQGRSTLHENVCKLNEYVFFPLNSEGGSATQKSF